MRFKTFRMVAISVGAALVSVLVLVMVLAGNKSTDESGANEPQGFQSTPEPSTSDDTPTERPQETTTPDEPYPAVQALRSVDRQIIAVLDRGISEERQSDVLAGNRIKVNVYRDSGFTEINRLKVDLDRDERWDEKWDIEYAADGNRTIARRISPDDDEEYTVRYMLEGDSWVRDTPPVEPPDEGTMAVEEQPTTPTPSADPPADSAQIEELRQLDERIVAIIVSDITSESESDVFSGDATKVNVYHDAGSAGVNRVKVDHDRDGLWDEKWDIYWTGSSFDIVRRVSPNDDEEYTLRYRYTESGWVLE